MICLNSTKLANFQAKTHYYSFSSTSISIVDLLTCRCNSGPAGQVFQFGMRHTYVWLTLILTTFHEQRTTCEEIAVALLANAKPWASSVKLKCSTGNHYSCVMVLLLTSGICWSYYVLIEVKAMPKALVGSPAEHSWCNLSNLNLSTARCQQFIARFMCIGLKANIPSSFMSFSERFYSQVLRQMVTRLLDMTTTLLLESS